MLEDKKIIIGFKQTLRMLEEGNVSDVYIAKDADFYVTRQIEEYAGELGINIIPYESMKKLGKQCGIDVGASVVAVLK